jgi:hypothetical protein
MSTPPVLTVLEEWGLIICESCKHAVWPKNVAGHCGKQHGVDLVQAAAIAAGYENDADLRHEPEELELPPFVETPVPFLPIYNGLACQVACRYVSITINSMLSHIKVAHRPAENRLRPLGCGRGSRRSGRTRGGGGIPPASASLPTGRNRRTSPSEVSQEGRSAGLQPRSPPRLTVRPRGQGPTPDWTLLAG